MATIVVQISNYINRKIKDIWNKGFLAKKCNLNFSKSELVGEKLIGLDVLKKRLFFLKQKQHIASCCIIDLHEVKTCSVRKVYNHIEAGALKKRRLEEYLNTICLYFSFKNGRRAIALPFYETHADPIQNIPELEAKANDWRKVVSKLLPLQVKERA